MHERAVAHDLLSRALTAASDAGGELKSIELVVGPLSGYTEDGLRSAIATDALERCGSVPEIKIVASTDVADPFASGVVLRSIGVEN